MGAGGFAQAQTLTPGANLVIEGIPPISDDLVAKVAPYTEFRPSTLVAWHPAKPGVLILKPATNTEQLYFVASPGSEPEQWTDFPDAVAGATFQPKKGEYILFEKASDGDEVFRIFRMDIATRAVTPISTENERASPPSWNRKGDRIVYTTVAIDRQNAARRAVTKLYIANPLNPAGTRHIATFDRGGVGEFRFSPDDRKLVYQEYISVTESHIWLLDIAGGEKKRVSPPKKTAAPAYYGSPRFSKDGKGLYAVSDRDSEFRRLIYIDLATGKETGLTAGLKFDVDAFSISYPAKRIALITSESGSSVLRFLDLATGRELPRPALLPGEISGLRWRGAGDDDAEGEDFGKELAFNVTSSRSPGDVYAFDLESTRIHRWTNSLSPTLNPLDFVEPRLAHWKSFDGLVISGFVYQPEAKKFPGKRPVIIDIHGGPESLARPGFLDRDNYLVNELGVAMIFPNVRGSGGFGKTFVALDDGTKREDSVKDIGALFDWINEQPDLDASRILVQGTSYGGYMSLAVAMHYSDRITGAIDVVGISSFVTFLTNTESYRRDLRRAEYGDERDPAMRAFFEKISPLSNAEKIRKPLFVVQGRNDPRVHYSEAEQIVAQLKKHKTPVWFLMANDEGHGFAKKENADYMFYAQIKFIEQTLLK
ncbi:MAG: S9 family peptidase [Betaproteobacteria bacterium]|nr:S9 family peptidase [Betaproteobacteria bacterium]